MKNKTQGFHKHDDLDLGLSVAGMLAIGLVTVLLLPASPILAQLFLVVALVMFAAWVAIFDYHD